MSTVREEYELISVLSIEKVEKSSTYICKASNIINNDEKSVEVETGDRFTAVRISKGKGFYLISNHFFGKASKRSSGILNSQKW